MSTVGALRAEAARSTSPAVERAVGVLLGARREEAAAAVDALAATDRLADGLAAVAAVLAARRGTDAAGAVAELADGCPPPEGWSDYELRTAAEEIRDDLDDVLRAPRGTTEVSAQGADAPVEAALALRAGGLAVIRVGAAAGHLLDGLSLRRALVDAGFIADLARAAGRRLEARAGTPEVDDLHDRLADPGAALPADAGTGLDEVVVRSPVALRLLAG